VSGWVSGWVCGGCASVRVRARTQTGRTLARARARARSLTRARVQMREAERIRVIMGNRTSNAVKFRWSVSQSEPHAARRSVRVTFHRPDSPSHVPPAGQSESPCRVMQRCAVRPVALGAAVWSRSRSDEVRDRRSEQEHGRAGPGRMTREIRMGPENPGGPGWVGGPVAVAAVRGRERSAPLLGPLRSERERERERENAPGNRNGCLQELLGGRVGAQPGCQPTRAHPGPPGPNRAHPDFPGLTGFLGPPEFTGPIRIFRARPGVGNTRGDEWSGRADEWAR
jgi:hypothetical protein